MSSVAKRVLTGATLILAVAGMLWLDGVARDGLVPWSVGIVLAGLSIVELLRMRALALSAPMLGAALVAVAVILRPWAEPLLGADAVARPITDYVLILVLVVAAVFGWSVGGLSLFRRPRVFVRNALAGLWVVPGLMGLLLVDGAWGVRGLVVLVALSKVGDIFGYFVGRSIGRSHPFPRISPGKTTAGCVASLVSAVLLGGVLAATGTLPGAAGGTGPGLVAGCLTGLLINLASQAGDLLESVVKRRAGVKDSSTWVGASGGVLDVVDSLLLSVPVACLSWPYLFGNG